MKMITNLDDIKRMAIEKERENDQFRAFLKRMDISGEAVDARVHPIVAEVMAQIDCTKCANCCKTRAITLSEADVVHFVQGLTAQGVDMTIPAFKEKYMVKDSQHENARFIDSPCPFLKDNKCTNYEYRPEDCRDFPHLHKEGFLHRTIGMVINYESCPIVYNVVEQLKREFRFQLRGSSSY